MIRRAIALGGAALALTMCVATTASAEDHLGQWGSFNEDPVPGTFNEIKDIATDPRGYVYVLDELLGGAGRVQKFTSDGQLVRQFGVPADPDDRWDTVEFPDAIASPSGITVGPDRNVYVAESGERTRISVWSPLGRFLRSFGSGGSGDGQLYGPAGMLVDSSGNLGVADSGNGRIAVFGPGGNWVNQITGLDSPSDIAALGDNLYLAAGDTIFGVPASGSAFAFGLDDYSSVASVAGGSGKLYAAYPQLSQVMAFSPAGALLGPVARTPGSLPGQLTEPNAVDTDCHGTLYVADAGNFRIQKFGSPGAPACGNVAGDKEERLVIRLVGKRKQRFREAFAVQATVNCDRPCSGNLSGKIKIKGRRKPIRLVSEPLTREFPGPAVTNVAPTERGTDIVVAALERRKKLRASIKLVARDLTGRKVTRKKTYLLR